MSAKISAEAIIAELRGSADAYEKAAVRESEIWGKAFSDPQLKRAREEDQAAARTLGVAKGRLSLVAIVRQEAWHFGKGLSLACGSGRAERELIRLGVCRSFLGIDISAGALEEARAEGLKAQYDIEYRVGDLNRLTLPEAEFEIVVTQNCLHHVLELEHLAHEIWRSLRPGGLLWVDDFVGETQFQWDDKRLAFANGLLEALPDKYRTSRLNGKPLGPFQRRPPGQLVSPFEAIRSAEIVPVFSRFFEIVRKHEWDAILHQLLCPVGFRAAYAETEEGKLLFAMLKTTDALLVQTGMLPPLGGQYLMRRKETPTI